MHVCLDFVFNYLVVEQLTKQIDFWMIEKVLYVSYPSLAILNYS